MLDSNFVSILPLLFCNQITKELHFINNGFYAMYCLLFVSADQWLRLWECAYIYLTVPNKTYSPEKNNKMTYLNFTR